MGRSALGAALVSLAAACVLLVELKGCVGSRGRSCTTSSDCEQGSFCADSGFCDSECRSQKDCPCGSSCVSSCGLCVREDGRGPATCFAFRNGLSTDEVLSVCELPAPGDQATGGGEMGQAGAGALCVPAPVTLPLCVESPPQAAEGGGAGASGAGGNGGEGGAP